MRQMTYYSEAVKASILSKAIAPNGINLVELAKESNIPYSTLYCWKRKMINKPNGEDKRRAQRPKDKSVKEKLRCVLETMDKTTEEQGAYCRTNGIYTHHLESWQKQMLEGLGGGNKKERKAQAAEAKNEIKELKRDLHRKDKALAEVSALLILKKKAELLWGENEDA